MELFKAAAALDPKHVRSRYYVAGEETRLGDYADAARDWTALLALGKGDEPWVGHGAERSRLRRGSVCIRTRRSPHRPMRPRSTRWSMGSTRG